MYVDRSQTPVRLGAWGTDSDGDLSTSAASPGDPLLGFGRWVAICKREYVQQSRNLLDLALLSACDALWCGVGKWVGSCICICVVGLDS